MSPPGQEIPYLELYDPDLFCILGKNLAGTNYLCFEVCLCYSFNTSVNQALFILCAPDKAVNKTNWTLPPVVYSPVLPLSVQSSTRVMTELAKNAESQALAQTY